VKAIQTAVHGSTYTSTLTANVQSGLFIVMNNQGSTALASPVIKAITSTSNSVDYTPQARGTVKVIAIIFDSSGGVEIKKDVVTVEKKILTCPATCSKNTNCECNFSDCNSGIFILINTTSPSPLAERLIISGISGASTKSFTPISTGTLKALAICFDPTPINFNKQEIAIV
jgi:hypothetical protein